MSQSDPNTTPGSKVALICAAYERGEGGYIKIAKRFGVSRDTVRGYVRQGAAWVACTRKMKYETEREAHAALSMLRSDRGTDREAACGVYECPHCAGFHIGHFYEGATAHVGS